MQTTIVLDRGRAGAERIAEAAQQLPPVLRLVRRRKSRTEQAADAFQNLPTAARIGLVAAAAGVALGLAVVARKYAFGAGADAAEDATG